MCAIACNHQYVLCMYVFHLSACNKLLIIINGYQGGKTLDQDTGCHLSQNVHSYSPVTVGGLRLHNE